MDYTRYELEQKKLIHDNHLFPSYFTEQEKKTPKIFTFTEH